MRLSPIVPKAVTSTTGVTGDVAATGATGQTAMARPFEFQSMLQSALDQVQTFEARADEAARQLVVGKAEDIHQVVIASEKATLGLQLAIAVRNKVLEAYLEIMRMQV